MFVYTHWVNIHWVKGNGRLYREHLDQHEWQCSVSVQQSILACGKKSYCRTCWSCTKCCGTSSQRPAGRTVHGELSGWGIVWHLSRLAVPQDEFLIIDYKTQTRDWRSSPSLMSILYSNRVCSFGRVHSLINFFIYSCKLCFFTHQDLVSFCLYWTFGYSLDDH